MTRARARSIKRKRKASAPVKRRFLSVDEACYYWRPHSSKRRAARVRIVMKKVRTRSAAGYDRERRRAERSLRFALGAQTAASAAAAVAAAIARCSCRRRRRRSPAARRRRSPPLAAACRRRPPPLAAALPSTIAARLNNSPSSSSTTSRHFHQTASERWTAAVLSPSRFCASWADGVGGVRAARAQTCCVCGRRRLPQKKKTRCSAARVRRKRRARLQTRFKLAHTRN